MRGLPCVSQHLPEVKPCLLVGILGICWLLGPKTQRPLSIVLNLKQGLSNHSLPAEKDEQRPQVFQNPHPGNMGHEEDWRAYGWGHEVVSSPLAKHQGSWRSRSGGVWWEALSPLVPFLSLLPSLQSVVDYSDYISKNPVKPGGLAAASFCCVWQWSLLSGHSLKTEYLARKWE